MRKIQVVVTVKVSRAVDATDAEILDILQEAVLHGFDTVIGEDLGNAGVDYDELNVSPLSVKPE